MHHLLRLTQGLAPFFLAAESVDLAKHDVDLLADDLLAMIVNLIAEQRCLLPIAKRAFHVLDQRQRRFIIAAGKVFLDRAAKGVAVLVAERDLLGPVAEQLLLADDIEQHRNLLQSLGEGGDDFFLTTSIRRAVLHQRHRQRPSDQHPHHANASGGKHRPAAILDSEVNPHPENRGGEDEDDNVHPAIHARVDSHIRVGVATTGACQKRSGGFDERTVPQIPRGLFVGPDHEILRNVTESA